MVVLLMVVVVVVVVMVMEVDDACSDTIALPVLSLVASTSSHLQILEYFDYVFTAVFTVEIVLKVSEGYRTRISGYKAFSAWSGSNLHPRIRLRALRRNGRERR